MSNQNDVLEQYGGLQNNSLCNKLSNLDNHIDCELYEEPPILQISQYVDFEALIDILKEKDHVFKILSLNCQSLFAKIDQLQVLVNMIRDKGSSFDVICLQETWVSPDTDIGPLQLDDYIFLNQHWQCSRHGGLGIYIKETLDFKLMQGITHSIWEEQFIEVNLNNTKITIGNVYRLPHETNEDYLNFTAEFSDCIRRRDCNHLVVCGDFNIDLLKIDEKPSYNDFFESVLSLGLVPKITLPTRFSRNRATLIDNFYSKISNNFSKATSGILINNISHGLLTQKK